jgi:hypothetical protein
MSGVRRIFNFASLFLIFFSAAPVRGAEPKTPIDGIEDNSFLVEEAYNQEEGVVQHIFNAVYSNDPRQRGWAFNFTQEWPVFSQDHQFSYSIPSFHIQQGGQQVQGIGDILLNYRYQLLEEGDRKPAIAPRFSLILPTGNRRKGTGNGVVGYQWLVPFSKKLPPRLAFHADLGLTYLPGVRVPLDAGGLSSKRSLVSPNLAASTVFAFSSRVHAMLEWVGTFQENIDGNGKTKRDFISVISPGVRASVIDEENLQTVVGVGLPIGVTRPAPHFGVFLYFSIEHNFL